MLPSKAAPRFPLRPSRRQAWASPSETTTATAALDVVKTNFAGDTDSLYTNLGDASFEDRTYPSGLGVNTRLLGWGVGFFDMDNDGWLDLLMSNGHVYPEVDERPRPTSSTRSINTCIAISAMAVLKRSRSKGGPGIMENAPARGCAFGDYDNDGNIDIAVNCINSIPQLLHCDVHACIATGSRSNLSELSPTAPA